MSIKDRDQKQNALRLAIANRWFPQLEVDVNPGKEVRQTVTSVTDLDVLASIPDEFKGFRSVVFDCKTKAKESPVNRALWLAGVIERIKADQGFCILKRSSIEPDHCLMANSLNVILLTEDEFHIYATATCANYNSAVGNIGSIDAWDRLFKIGERYPRLNDSLIFARTKFWMAEDSADACRRSVAILRRNSAEYDPTKPEHVTLFFEFCALFARSLAVVVCRLFKIFLQPSSKMILAESLLMMLYGGRENYKYRSEVFRAVRGINDEDNRPELLLPEWDRLLHLVRQLLDAPMAVQHCPLILREVGFAALCGDKENGFAKILCAEGPQAARFAILIADYLSKAAKLPPEFNKIADEALLSILTIP